jgi:hypothetical protein
MFKKIILEKYLNPIFNNTSWHTNILQRKKILAVPLLHIQVINSLIFREQSLMSFLEPNLSF